MFVFNFVKTFFTSHNGILLMKTSNMKLHCKNPISGSSRNLYCACGVAYLAALSFGLVIGYTSTALPQLIESNMLTAAEGDWFAALLNVGAFAGCFVGGYLLERYGRKMALMTLTLPYLSGWLTIGVGSSANMLYLGRLLCGAGGGMTVVVAPAYVSEISSKEQRGMLGAGVQLAITVGILLSYTAGMLVSWSTLAQLSALSAVLQFALNTKVVDTPRFLLMRDMKKEALQALAWLRGPVADIDEECRDIEENLPDKTEPFSLTELTKPELLAPLKVAAGLTTFQQLTGINAVMFFTVAIFQSAGFPNSHQATVMVGVVQVLFTVVACLLMDRAGRRLLLLVAGIGMMVSCLALSYYYYASSTASASPSSLGWLALLSVLFYIVFFSLGWGPVPALVMSELLPVRARGAAGALCMACSWSASFLITLYFSRLQGALGAHGVFALFAACCALGSLFVARALPETKGKSLEDIELYFLGRAMRA